MDNIQCVPVGGRIILDGSFGTVKFCGQIQGKNGLWYGVDWDDEMRGKHNGEFDGVIYFSTTYPTSGSFVQASKVDTGRSLAEAIEDRYNRCHITLTHDDRLLPQKSRDRLIDFVGFEKVAGKISQLEKLTNANVCQSRVSSVGNVSSLVPNLIQLDLSKNLIWNWDTVIEILNSLPFLSTLDLSGNRMLHPKTKLPLCSQLSTLVLNSMDLTWDDIQALDAFLSTIQDLTAVSNRISSLNITEGMLQNVTHLCLSLNNIASWEEVNKLGHLPKLISLNLMENSLDSVRFPESHLFESLQSLNLANNRIGTWLDVAELSKLPKLEKLWLAENPVLSLQKSQDARQLVIAKIRTLKTLEAIEISIQERKGAEWDYIRKHWQKSKDDANFLAEHPSYSALLKIHGPPETSEKPDLSHERIPLLSLNIYSPLIPDQSPIVRRIPANIVVGRLKQMIRKWLHIDAKVLILSYKMPQENSPEISIDDDTQFLSFYAVGNGDNLCVQW